eukprot:Seg1508.8 transcript_id=Seg1508.8/GoldUCD/mRNA.D3Y31 product="hypothetical protein" protein_id=Seg1508.8/GoldUCD/D3Y31
MGFVYALGNRSFIRLFNSEEPNKYEQSDYKWDCLLVNEQSCLLESSVWSRLELSADSSLVWPILSASPPPPAESHSAISPMEWELWNWELGTMLSQQTLQSRAVGKLGRETQPFLNMFLLVKLSGQIRFDVIIVERISRGRSKSLIACLHENKL